PLCAFSETRTLCPGLFAFGTSCSVWPRSRASRLPARSLALYGETGPYKRRRQHAMRGLGDHLSIGERIAFYRKRRGYTQEVLAGLVGRSTDWLAKIETGRRKPPRIDMLAELSRILRVPLGDLLGQTVLVEDERQQDDVPAVR